MKTSTLNWLSGLLGIWLMATVLLGFSSTLNRIIFIVTGLAITIFSFWSASRLKTPTNNESEIIPPPK